MKEMIEGFRLIFQGMAVFSIIVIIPLTPVFLIFNFTPEKYHQGLILTLILTIYLPTIAYLIGVVRDS